jgi:nucleotide-binding universal stress UspA family protein
MKEIQLIVVPVDFLQHTDQLVEYALYMAKKFNAKIKFIHVVEISSNWGDVEYSSLASFTAELDEHKKHEMQNLVKRQKERYPACTGKVLQGNISDSITGYAENEKADLIIIGTHGHRGLKKLWLGSVAERVIRQAPCPTLTCNPYK